jgi:hypothetical protein
MAGELCGRGCAWCGRCDAEPDDVCDCGRADRRGDCDESIDADQDERLDAIDDAGEVRILGRSGRRS